MRSMTALVLLLFAGAIVYVLVKRPTVTASNVTGPSTSNAVWGVLGSIGGNIVSSLSTGGNKIGAPSAVTGATSSYNNLSSADFDTLAAGDAAMGVEGPF